MHKQSLSGADQKLYEIAEEIAMKGYDVTQYER
ncbi:hypothetical protein Cyrtocomes_01061 [Candidatus Cyrtobacter comes]|uniref:Uncharacterized protein n=1 Tax=Candidatus Cyrtobacter comes TaxID=675776 RepID=A0ABU5L9V6_9RICK|nr:hypothetical protein [Candidatus Cyrtobacter comes]